MEKIGDKKLEKRLKKVVELALLEDGVEHTVRKLRARAEKELKLEEGFFEAQAWKQRSKDIINAAFNEFEPDEDSPQPGSSRPVLPSETPEPKSNGKTGEESSDDSDEGSSSEGDGSGAHQDSTEQSVGQAKTSTTVNGVKRKTGETSSERDSSDDSSESESGSEAGSEAQQPAQKKAKVTPSHEPTGDLHSSQGEKQINTHYLGPIAAKGFHPPSGYSQVDFGSLSADPKFSQTKLQNKQIWYLSAPSDLPLGSLAHISQAALKSRAPILSHNGNDFILGEATEHTDDSHSCVLMPTDGGYERTSHKVHRTLRIQQKIALPDLNARQANQLTGSDAAANVGRAAIKSVRPQPKGLRMRYRPPGFGTGPLGSVGSESTDSADEDDLNRREAPRTFQFPKTMGAYGTEARQDGDIEMVDAPADPSQAFQRDEARKARKEKKKRDKDARKTNASSAPVNVNGAVEEPGDSRPVSAGIQDVAREESPNITEGNDLPNGVAKDAETKEEKARRKEEKRARKSAKKERKLQTSKVQ